MKRILFIFQLILKLFLIFILAFIWARYFIKSLWLSLVVSAIATILIDYITRIISKRRNNSSSLKIKEKEEAENMFLSLATSKNSLSFYENLAKTRHPSVERKSKFILINHSEKSRTCLYPFLLFKELEPDDLTKIINEIKASNCKKLVIVCNNSSKEALSLAKNFDINIVILDKFETYKLLYKEYDYFPKISIKYKKDKKLAIKDLIAYAFNKTKTKGYLICALILFLAGFIVKASLYYSIFASILVVFALICQLNIFNKCQGEVL